jgi:hypothetical protein
MTLEEARKWAEIMKYRLTEKDGAYAFWNDDIREVRIWYKGNVRSWDFYPGATEEIVKRKLEDVIWQATFHESVADGEPQQP